MTGEPYGTKSNVMIVGPTGCGKTYLIKQLEKIFNRIPFLHIDATSLSKEGYSGDSLEDVVSKWVSDVGAPSNYGVVFVDEVDKICLPSADTSGTWNLAIQHSLLKLVEGKQIYNRGYKGAHSENMLFIFGGNFESVRKQLFETTNKRSIGFHNPVEQTNDLHRIHVELTKVGMLPELIGRISQITEVTKFTKKELKELFLNPIHGPYENYRNLFEFALGELKLSNYYINKIVDICLVNETGARGLQTAMDEVIKDMIFNIEPIEVIDITAYR